MKTHQKIYSLLTLLVVIFYTTFANAGLGFWTSNGPDGGQVYDLAADPVTPDTFYATTRGGVYKSVNGGLTWQIINNGITANFVNRIAHHNSMAGIVYVASNSSVFKTIDGGLNWNVSNLGLPTSDRFTDIEISPLSSDIIYLATAIEGVYKSINGGASWSAANTGLVTLIDALKVSPTDSNRVYAAAPNGLYETLDGGLTWLDRTGLLPAPFSATSAVNNIVFAGFAGEVYVTTSSGVFKSSDNGVTWLHLDDLIGREIAVNPSNSNEIIVSGTVGVWTTTNSGVNWSQTLVDFVGNGNEVSGSSVVIYNPFNPTTTFAGTNSNGVYKKTISDPQWIPQITGMNAENIRGLAIANYPDSSSRVFAGIGDVFSPSYVSFISDDQGLTWAQNNTGLDASNFREIEVDKNTTTDRISTHLYAVGRDVPSITILGDLSDADGGIYKSINGGATWMTIDNGIPLSVGPPVSSLFGTVRDVSIDLSSSIGGGPSQVIYVAGSGRFTSNGVGPATTVASRIYKSSDAGANWIASDVGISVPDSSSTFIFPAAVKVVIDQTTPTILYAATFLTGPNLIPAPTIENGIWKSIDAGTTWNLNSNGLPTIGAPGTSNYNVLSLAIDPITPTRLYASVHDPVTLESEIYKSEDSAATWVLANTGIATSDIRDILVASNGDAYVAAAGNSGNPGGVYRSQDFGATWQSMNVGLDSIVSVTQLDLDELGVNPLVYAGTEQSVHSFEVVPDGDSDGVPDVTEGESPNNGDGNNDGTDDSTQNHVSSFPANPIDASLTRNISGKPSEFVTIEVAAVNGSCDTLEDVHSLTNTTVPNDLHRSFDYGAVRFEIVDCTEANVTITFHGAADFVSSGWSYRIYAPTISGNTEFHWQDIPATVTNNEWTINLSDGQFGDIRPNNGRILFQGGPAFNDLIFTNGFE